MSGRKSLRFWFKAARPEFFVAPLGALLIGVAVAWSRYEVFNIVHFLLTILGVMLLNFGINLANDYYDYSGGSGTDALNIQPTPFSGGSRLLPEGLAKPKQILMFSVLCFLGSLLVGLYFFLYSKSI